MSDTERQVAANFAQVLANLELVRASRWRLFRNWRLLDDCWHLTSVNNLLWKQLIHVRTCCPTPWNTSHTGMCPNSVMRCGTERFLVNEVLP